MLSLLGLFVVEPLRIHKHSLYCRFNHFPSISTHQISMFIVWPQKHLDSTTIWKKKRVVWDIFGKLLPYSPVLTLICRLYSSTVVAFALVYSIIFVSKTLCENLWFLKREKWFRFPSVSQFSLEVHTKSHKDESISVVQSRVSILSFFIRITTF